MVRSRPTHGYSGLRLTFTFGLFESLIPDDRRTTFLHMATIDEVQRLALDLPESQRAALTANLLESLSPILHEEDEGVAEALRRDAVRVLVVRHITAGIRASECGVDEMAEPSSRVNSHYALCF